MVSHHGVHIDLTVRAFASDKEGSEYDLDYPLGPGSLSSSNIYRVLKNIKKKNFYYIQNRTEYDSKSNTYAYKLYIHVRLSRKMYIIDKRLLIAK